MRKIKFEVFEGGKKLGVESLDPIFAGWQHTLCDDLSEDGSPWVRGGTIATQHEAIRRQYSGLKDKNGREIYEGDIVDCRAIPPVVVEWKIDLAGWDPFVCRQTPYGKDGIPSRFCDIIGNIYENPELIPT